MALPATEQKSCALIPRPNGRMNRSAVAEGTEPRVQVIVTVAESVRIVKFMV
jgi:hypothetical protein